MVNAEFEGDLEFGADAIGAGDKDRLLEFARIELEEAAKAADFAQDILVKCPLRKVLDALFSAVAAGDVDPGVSIGDGRFSRSGI